MRYFLDTGILLRLPDRSDALHAAVRESVRKLSRHELVTSTQNISEFWNVCTRPATSRGGLELSINTTYWRLRLLERSFEVLTEPPSAYSKWKSWVTTLSIHGRQVHDARLVALMAAYRIRHILTLNTADFKRYPQIEAIRPLDVVRS